VMQLCNTSGCDKGLTLAFVNFTLLSNVTLGLLELRITRQDSAYKVLYGAKI